MKKLGEIFSSIGFFVILLGADAMDSEQLIYPFMICGSGMMALLLGEALIRFRRRRYAGD